MKDSWLALLALGECASRQFQEMAANSPPQKGQASLLWAPLLRNLIGPLEGNCFLISAPRRRRAGQCERVHAAIDRSNETPSQHHCAVPAWLAGDDDLLVCRARWQAN